MPSMSSLYPVGGSLHRRHLILHHLTRLRQPRHVRIGLHASGGRDIRHPPPVLTILEAPLVRGGVMRPALLLSACLGGLVSGCGTVNNLTAPPLPSGSPEGGPTECSPFGGVTRSALLSVYGLAGGLSSIPGNKLDAKQLQ